MTKEQKPAKEQKEKSTKQSKDNVFRVYKKLILEVLDTHFCSNYEPWREKYTSKKFETRKDGTLTDFERIKSIDEDFVEAVNNLAMVKGRFYQYDNYGHLIKSYYDVLKWRDFIERTQGLEDTLDIKQAILVEMERQEKELIKNVELSPAEKGRKVVSAFKKVWKLVATGIALIILILKELHSFEWLWEKMRLL